MAYFSTEEYGARLAGTRRAMQERDIDVLIVTDPSNMAWLTGYDGWSFYVHQAVIISHTEEPIWWGRAMDALGALRTVIMADDNVVGYDDTYVQNPQKHPMETLATLLHDRSFTGRNVGVELDNYYYSAAAHASLTRALPGRTFIVIPVIPITPP